jgi:O-antigen/teichoic acid export membrane protein
VRYRLVTRVEYRQLSSIVLTLGVGTVAMLLISGVDVIVVGVVEFQRVQPYSLATSLVLVFASGYTIIGAALLPAFSELEATNDRAGTERLLWRTSVIGCSVLGSGLVILVALAHPIVGRWAGPYADQAIPVFVILASAQALRLSLLPAATFLFSSTDHRYARRIVVTEASVNLTSSIVLGLLFGYKGVAVGTLVGTLPTFPLMWLYVGAAGVQPSRGDRPTWHAFLVPAFLTASAVALDSFVIDALPIRCIVAFIVVLCLVRIGWREVRGTPTESLNSAHR